MECPEISVPFPDTIVVLKGKTLSTDRYSYATELGFFAVYFLPPPKMFLRIKRIGSDMIF
jgi:hypothetical protein